MQKLCLQKFQINQFIELVFDGPFILNYIYRYSGILFVSLGYNTYNAFSGYV